MGSYIYRQLHIYSYWYLYIKQRSSFPSIIGRVVVDSKPVYQAVVVMAFQFEKQRSEA